MKLKDRIVMILVLTVLLSVVLIVQVRIQVTLSDVEATSTASSTMHSLATAAQKPSPMLPHEVPNRTRASDQQGLRRNQPSQAERLKVSSVVSSRDPWAIWGGWVTPGALYPEGSFYSEEMNHILAVMATAPITSFGVGYKGTQLKATAMLGTQRAVFKPKR